MGESRPDLEAIFFAACQKPPPEQAAYLDEVCRNDPVLRQRAEQFLSAQLDIGSFLESGAHSLTTTIDDPITEGAGTVIGPYKLLQHIGEGGMGIVYMAEQAHPVRRKVALKIIKPGMDSRQVIARFEAERQALALMDHPSIAKVLDAGTTESGRPFFVMELVKGVPITKYCDEHQLTPRERLELFIPVCQAVQHAHHKGIIHRDIKPSNVMVCIYDAKPVAKIIDFGVAKATGPKLTERTLYTGFGAIVGTFEYMSPEQAMLDQLDVDTRSDVYSLGVLLYELLTGTTPLERKRMKEATILELLRLVREEEAPRPSTRLSTSERLPSIAANRRTEPKKLSGLMRGELDWIVMKALEKDRSRRYETANSLALDIGRYLRDEQVQACPPSAAYRFRKFARRHKGALAATALAAAALVLSVVVLAISNALVATERDQKARALEDRERALAQERAARDEAEEARKETEFGLYAQTLAHAQREREAGNVGLAEKLLDDPRFEKLRGWEWHYLKRLLYGSLRPLRHSSAMSGPALSRDGRLLAAGGTDGNVKLWDTGRWEEVRAFHAHDSQVRHVAFAPDGRLLATAGLDGTAKIWEVATGVRLHTLEHGDTKEVGTVVFAPDGRWLISGGSDAVKIWEVRTGHLVRTLPVHATHSIAFSPGGRCLAVGNDDDDTIQLWDMASGVASAPAVTKLRTLGPHTGEVRGLAFRADGAQLAAACGQLCWNGREGEVKVWDLATGQPVRTLRGHIGGALAVAFAPDGLRLASAGVDDAVVKLWDVQAGEETLTLRGHSDAVWGLAFSPDGRRLYSASIDRTVRGWDATPVGAGERPLGRTLPGHTEMVTSLAFSPDNQYLVSGSVDRSIRIWDATSGEAVRTLTGHTGHVRAVAFSPDGLQLASAAQCPQSPDGELKIWSTNTWREIPSYGRFDEGPFATAFRADGKLAMAMGSHVVILDTTAHTRLLTLQARPIGFDQIGVAVGATGQVASCGADGGVEIWNLSSRDEIIPFTALVRPWEGLGYLLDIFRATTREPVRVIAAHEGRAMSVAFSPDGQTLASVGQDGAINFWDAKTFQPIDTLRAHLGGVHCLTFRPDGKRFASAGADAAIRVWDTITRRMLLTFRGHTNAIYAMAFSPDGRHLASGGWDGTVRIWDADPAPESRRGAAGDP
jgi:WD40 repeat protein/serine/threonine protein kinase